MGDAIITTVDGQSLNIGDTIALSSGDGSVTLQDATTIQYTASSSASGNTINFDYTVADGDGDSDTSTVHVSVLPLIVDDTAVVDQDNTVNIDVLGNDPSASILPLTITNQTSTNGSNGTTTVNSDGTIDYTPTTGFSGTDSFSYEVTGLAGGLQYQFFDGLASWDSVDDIPENDPDNVGLATDLDPAALSIAHTGSASDYGVRYSGKLYVDSADVYEFTLQSNNGSRIYVNGTLVADNDNTGGTTSNIGSISLGSGYHDILIEHYDWGGSSSLLARISGADTGGVLTNLLDTGRVGSAVVTQSATVDLTINDTQAPTEPTVTITEDANDDEWITSSELAGGSRCECCIARRRSRR